MKNKIIAFTIADQNNIQYAKMLQNSLRKFHSEEEIPLIIYDQNAMNAIADDMKYYKATPLFARKLIKDYDIVLKLDSDQIITGKLDFIFKIPDYDVATVLNFNRIDAKRFGLVSCVDIPPQLYFNCGFVAMRSEQFVEHWWALCNSYHFNSFQYKEQDLLNIMCHFGNYKVRCLDHFDPIYQYSSWHGLASKGEWNKIQLRDKQLVLPKADDNYPERDKTIRCIHFAGGQNEKKMNYQVYFNEEIIRYIDWLVSDSTNEYKR